MRRSRLPVDRSFVVKRRRGRVRETRAASGFPLSVEQKRDEATDAASIANDSLDRGQILLDAPQVAALLGIGRTKVYELIATRQIPVIPIGRCVRVPRDGLRAWIASRTEFSGGR
jgi:excisionase family DNA binding protein